MILFDIVIAMFAFAFISSLGYIINDYRDQENDLKLASKKVRAQIIATIPYSQKLLIVIFLLFTSLGLGAKFGIEFAVTMLAYLGVGTLYSIYLKKIKYLDIGIIALLQLFRIGAGYLVIKSQPNLVLSAIVFVVVVMLTSQKRISEMIQAQKAIEKHNHFGRPYSKDDRKSLTFLSKIGFILSLILGAYYLFFLQLSLLLPIKFATYLTYVIVVLFIFSEVEKEKVATDPVVYFIRKRRFFVMLSVWILLLFFSEWI